MTPAQQAVYARLTASDWEFGSIEANGTIFLERWERGAEYAIRVAALALGTDGTVTDVPHAPQQMAHCGSEEPE